MKTHVPTNYVESFEREGAQQNKYSGTVKRAIDICFIILVAPFALPIVAALWALVRLDGGPGFYVQKRVGMGGRRFNFYKLRTMVEDSQEALATLIENDATAAAEWHTMQKLSGDPRVTKLGRFLRASSLDELPQLWNVFVGDMSVVGPRPFMIDQELDYLEAGGLHYYQMKPGITGAWQVSLRNEVKFTDRVKFDNDYWDNLSLGTDVSILLKTIPAVLGAKGK